MNTATMRKDCPYEGWRRNAPAWNGSRKWVCTVKDHAWQPFRPYERTDILTNHACKHKSNQSGSAVPQRRPATGKARGPLLKLHVWTLFQCCCMRTCNVCCMVPPARQPRHGLQSQGTGGEAAARLDSFHCLSRANSFASLQGRCLLRSYLVPIHKEVLCS